MVINSTEGSETKKVRTSIRDPTDLRKENTNFRSLLAAVNLILIDFITLFHKIHDDLINSPHYLILSMIWCDDLHYIFNCKYKTCGKPCPSHYNPKEHFLNCSRGTTEEKYPRHCHNAFLIHLTLQ